MAGASSTVTIERRGDREIVYSREFDAPRELVFKVLTDPKLIPNWWGPRAYKTVVDKMEVRPGGAWRYLNITPDGPSMREDLHPREGQPSGRYGTGHSPWPRVRRSRRSNLTMPRQGCIKPSS